jgi:hypothetical protein
MEVPLRACLLHGIAMAERIHVIMTREVEFNFYKSVLPEKYN